MRKEEFLVGGGKALAARYGDPANPWVVFFAGWGAEIADYEDRLAEISQDFHIIAFSLPGFGFGEPLEGKQNTVRGHALFFVNILQQEINLTEPVILMGHSTGGGVATVVATEIPNLVSDLVLVCPVGSPDPLHRSGARLIKNINWVRARRWFSGDYRRRFIPNMLLGIDAKHLNLTADLKALRNQSNLRIRLFLAKEDHVAPPGVLSNLLEVEHIRWVEGGHSWFKHNASVVHEELMVLTASERTSDKSVEGGGWRRVIESVKAWLEELFVPSLPILIQSVENTESELGDKNEPSAKQ